MSTTRIAARFVSLGSIMPGTHPCHAKLPVMQELIDISPLTGRGSGYEIAEVHGEKLVTGRHEGPFMKESDRAMLLHPRHGVSSGYRDLGHVMNMAVSQVEGMAQGAADSLRAIMARDGVDVIEAAGRLIRDLFVVYRRPELRLYVEAGAWVILRDGEGAAE